MKLNHGLHLAYCTNIHPAETWRETFGALEKHALAVRDQVCPGKPYAIGLRLSEVASAELAQADTLRAFQKWLAKNDCYVFTINGFPFGRFHGARVKEQVYRPDWTSPERLAYTNRLFDLIGELTPAGMEGSVSTLPGSFKPFITRHEQEQELRANIWRCVEHVARVSERTGKRLHLGLEPEPLGWFENTAETVAFFERLRSEHPGDARLNQHLGVNYDTCHFAIEFEEPLSAMKTFQEHQIKISKLHLSSALKTRPTAATRARLAAFADDVYLHQVISRAADGKQTIYPDLAPALAASESAADSTEWRIHFHIPLQSPGTEWYEPTTDHIAGILDWLRQDPKLCAHLEMETYTWGVLPEALKKKTVVEQLVAEYEWTLAQLAARGLANR